MRIALGVEYDGSSFGGWQRQGHDPNTVQEKLEKALSRVADHEVGVFCAGRTDAGVHGVGQVVHFDTESVRDMRGWIFGCNTNLPDSISVRWAKIASDEFHARFSAKARAYRYVIYNHPVRPALGLRHLCWNFRPLELEPMQQAAQFLLGEHDFSAFRAQGCQAKSPVKDVQKIDLYRRGRLIVLDIQASAFLHHMVRNIAGVLMAIGAGKYPAGWAKDVLESRDRTQGAPTAAPYGLYFMRVHYPEHFEIPAADPDAPFMPL
ncbi:MAG: tRNA pseudouridine(38-40) synthase TruA [Pseudomonadota bacterium]